MLVLLLGIKEKDIMAYQIGLCDDEVYQIKVNSLFLREIAEKNNMDLECHGFSSGKQLKNICPANN